jgi:hypothetical protein
MVTRFRIQVGNHLGSFTAGYGVRAPNLEFPVSFRQVGIIGKYHLMAGPACHLDKLFYVGDNPLRSITSEFSRYKVVEHINDNYGFHFSFTPSWSFELQRRQFIAL